MTQKKGWHKQRKIESIYESLFNCVFGALINICITVGLLYVGYSDSNVPGSQEAAQEAAVLNEMPDPDVDPWGFLKAALPVAGGATVVFFFVSLARSYGIRRYNQWLLRNEKRPLGIRLCKWIMLKLVCLWRWIRGHKEL